MDTCNPTEPCSQSISLTDYALCHLQAIGSISSHILPWVISQSLPHGLLLCGQLMFFLEETRWLSVMCSFCPWSAYSLCLTGSTVGFSFFFFSREFYVLNWNPVAHGVLAINSGVAVQT